MKLKYRIIEKLHTLTRREFHLLLYACRIQDEATGRVEGVYYRDVMKHTGMCKQSVYNALRGLETKGIIMIIGHTDVDCDIEIIDNAFPDAAARSEGYVNLNREAFRSAAFRKLKGHEIYMLLEFLKGTHENGHSLIDGVDHLYEKYTKRLGVTDRVIRSYLHSLRSFFSIGIKAGKYYITYLHKKFEKPKPGEAKSGADWYREHVVCREFVRNRITYGAKDQADAEGLLRIYPPSKHTNVIQALAQSIAKSVEGIQCKDRTANLPWIHKLLRQALGLPETEKSKEEKERKAFDQRFQQIMESWNDPEPV